MRFGSENCLPPADLRNDKVGDNLDAIEPDEVVMRHKPVAPFEGLLRQNEFHIGLTEHCIVVKDADTRSCPYGSNLSDRRRTFETNVFGPKS